MRRAVDTNWAVLALLALAPALLHGAVGASVTGLVQDPAGAVVPRAGVSLLTSEQAIFGVTETDFQGRFSFSKVPAGSYVLVVLSRGFAERRIPVEVRESPVESLLVGLEVQAPQNQVTVTANLGSAEDTESVVQPVNVIAKESLRERATSVLAQVAKEEVGIHLQRTSPTIAGIYVRGLTGNKVNVFFDGVRYSNAAMRGGINTFFDLLEPSNLRAVEILRGPNSAQYGSDAIGGSIQLLSRVPSLSTPGSSALHGTLDTFFNSADAGFGSNLSTSYATRRLSLLVNLTGRRVNTVRPGGGLDSHSAMTRFLGLWNIPRDRDFRPVRGRSDLFVHDRLPDTAFTQYGGMIKVNWTPAPNSQLIAHYSRSQQDGGKRYDQLLGGDGNLVADLRNLMLDLAYLRYERFRLGWFDHFMAVYSLNSQREERVNQGGNGNPRASINHEYERTNVHGIQAHARKQWSGRHYLLTGADYYHERIHSPSFGFDPVTRIAAARRPRIPDNARYDSGGFYLQDIFDAFPGRLRLVGNVRYSAASYQARAENSPLVAGKRLWPDDSLKVSNVSFRGGVVATLLPGLNLYANVSRGFRAPHMTDLGTFGLSGSGFEVAAPDVMGLGATIGTTAGSSAVSTGRKVEQVKPETSLNYEVGARYRTGRLAAEFAFFINDIKDSITKQALILPPGAVGLPLAGQTITEQNPNGVVFVAAATNPVLVRANYDTTRIYGIEHTFDWQMQTNLSLHGVFTYLHAEDTRSGLPPNIEGGTPAPDGYLKLRYSLLKKRLWVEPYLHAAAPQDRLSSLDLEDRRTGATRSRASIRNFFFNGATFRGLVGAGPDGLLGTADDRLLATGETLAQVQDRVLGAGVQSAPLFLALPGYITFNMRAGLRLGEAHDILVDFENIGDRNYRGVSWGVDAPGRGIAIRYRTHF